MAQNDKLAELSGAGVAVWLDDLSRDRIRSGNLQQLVDEYSGVGVTLIFSPERYRAVMDAYLSGLEQRLEENPDASLAGIESVASFFVSRVDTEIDKRLDKAGADVSLKGKAGVANARLAYQAY